MANTDGTPHDAAVRNGGPAAVAARNQSCPGVAPEQDSMRDKHRDKVLFIRCAFVYVCLRCSSSGTRSSGRIARLATSGGWLSSSHRELASLMAVVVDGEVFR